ncbi:MAG: hypothetical protein GIW99_07580, partial [Candidatus Eremiobacteraeota bacterium]|nr:hypothetical protein [Candidatus Eremiobacteraeota bacterium]
MKTIWLAAVTFAVALAMQPSLGAAATIPTVEQSGRLFIGVEQLLATLDLHYDVQAQRLIVGDRTYPGAIVYRGGRHFADMQTLAAFLHLDVNRKGGALALSPRAQTENHSASTAVTGATLSQLRWRLIAVLNDHRRAQGLAPLVADPIASSAAQFQAEDMQRSGVMRHSDSQSHSPLERFMSLGGRAQAYAENVGYCGLDID